MPHWLTLVFVAAAATHLLVQLWLSDRQVRHVIRHRVSVPAAFAGAVTVEEHRKAADYTVARQRLGRVEVAFDLLVLLAMTLGGGIDGLRRLALSFGGPPLVTGILHVLAATLLLGTLSLPFTLWRTFVLEHRFGFNRTTPRVFVADLVKSILLGAVIGGTLLAVVLWTMAAAGAAWWLVAWAVWTVFSLVLLWAWPRWIAALFNKFVPLADAALRARIDALLARCDFHANHVYVMDGSKRSAHGNAYFTGLGREKRIVFFDTLLTMLTPAQVEAVLAHELAHYKLKHIPQRLVVGAVTTLAGFALLGWIARQPWVYQALGAGAPADSTALLLFVLALPAFTWPFGPLGAAWSRRHEFEADAFAARHSNGAELARALVSLYRDNASTLTPDPLHSAFHDSHPSPLARIARLQAAAHESRPAGATPALGPT